MQVQTSFAGAEARGIDGQLAAAGTKRKVEDASLSDEQRFAKRFNLLNLGTDPTNRNSNHYYTPPVQSPTVSNTVAEPSKKARHDESMRVDETRDRVYIADLDEELAEAELGEQEPPLIFLPDIEKHFSKIPQQVLSGRGVEADEPEPEHEPEGRELILYSVPSSLAVGDGRDSVRKAIIETRARAREKLVRDAKQQEMQPDMVPKTAFQFSWPSNTCNAEHAADPVYEADLDAMDMD